MNINTQFVFAPASPLPTAPTARPATEQISTRPTEKPSRSNAPVEREREQADNADSRRKSEASAGSTGDTPASNFSRNASPPAATPGKLLDVTA